uniref:Uncharacterized protein n=1 Tax=Rhizophora mucronata TaxID=61149 RepID=A0A2P2J8R0_RHIMU
MVLAMQLSVWLHGCVRTSRENLCMHAILTQNPWKNFKNIFSLAYQSFILPHVSIDVCI